MIIKGLTDEDFVNYKKTSMFIAFPSCTFKCEKECGEHCCQNSALTQAPNIDISTYDIVNRYLNNSITEAVVCGGLDPFDSWHSLKKLVATLRSKTEDDIVIYTGYREEEIDGAINYLKQFPNIIVKFGRYIPNQPKHYDEILGVELASNNQYAKKVS